MKYEVNSSFFDSWSSEMAYVLGFILADGSIEDASYLRGKYLRLHSNDVEILEKIKEALSSKHQIVKIDPQWSFSPGKKKKYLSKTKYLLRIGDHHIYNSLTKLGVTPHKSLTLKFPIVPVEYISDFIRGYFDGDGSVFVEKKKKRLLVVFCCGSYDFLESLSKILAKIAQVKKQRVLKGNRSFQLKYSTLESVKIYKLMYNTKNNLYLERKQAIFGQFMESVVPLLPKISKLVLSY
jgi:intein-encoded DNA endonuclease-like protein